MAKKEASRNTIKTCSARAWPTGLRCVSARKQQLSLRSANVVLLHRKQIHDDLIESDRVSRRLREENGMLPVCLFYVSN